MLNAKEMYKSWRTWFAADQKAMNELDAIANDEKEIEDRFYTTLSFGTGGMRGVLGMGENRMNIYTVRKATAGLCLLLHDIPGAAERGVVVSFDSRRMSAEFAKETALVLAAGNIKAYLFDSLRPVPVLSYSVRHLNAVAGIEITASHNPPQYNGYKVYWEDGAQLPPVRAERVMEAMGQIDYDQARPMDEVEARAKGLVVDVPAEVDNSYIAAVKTLCVNPDLFKTYGKALKLVYTPLHGSGNQPVRRVLSEMGVSPLVVSEQEKPDGNFPTVRVPNPEDPDVFKLAIEIANREGADMCFATDPDCDRLGVVARNHEGGFTAFTGNQIGCLLINYILSSRSKSGTLPQNGAIVKSIVSTELARKIADYYGVTTINTLTGFKFIAEQIQNFEETGAHTFLFGFEESYGFLSSTFVRDKDAVNASLLVTELALYLNREGKTLVDALEELYAKFGYASERVTSITLKGKDGLEKMQTLMTNLRRNPPQTIAGHKVLAVRDYKTGLRTQGEITEKLTLPTSDVLYYELDNDAWVCVRPSGTEPKIKLYSNAFAVTQAEAAKQAENLLNQMQELLA